MADSRSVQTAGAREQTARSEGTARSRVQPHNHFE
jgi:hypothetical protein